MATTSDPPGPPSATVAAGGVPESPASTAPDPSASAAGDPAPDSRDRSGGRSGWRERLLILVRGLAAGLSICLSIPPFGWWPLAFLGVAQWDQLLADQPWLRRFRRTWLVAAAWLFPSMLWMFDLTPPGYVIACAAYAAFFGALAVLVPPHRPGRWIALVGAIVLGELWRWSWPFGGVPLATLAMSQGSAPLAQAARLGNAIFVSALVAVGGVALSAAWERRYRFALVAAAAVVACLLVSLVAPRGHDTEPLRIAVVQGGGVQRTRFGNSDSEGVFRRHLDASARIRPPVDLVVWPENVVEVDGRLTGSPQDAALKALARRLGAPVIVGATEDGPDAHSFLNAAVVYLPDGTVGERFDKVTRVPFGEYVPLRPFIEAVASDSGIPVRDAVPGTGPAVVHTPAGVMGVTISWEVFFTDRAADGVDHGAEALLNPTNGSSYWLTEVQTQQLATAKLRAIETGRYDAQAAPTGFSTIINPNGSIIDCDVTGADGVTTYRRCLSDISPEDRVGGQAVLQATIARRQGDTIATVVGVWPTLLLAVAAMAGGWALDRRGRRGRSGRPRHGETLGDTSGASSDDTTGATSDDSTGATSGDTTDDRALSPPAE